MGKKEHRIMLSSLPSSCRRSATTAALALAIAGCGRPGTIDHPTVSGRRVQATDVVAHAAPLRVRAYELRFSDASKADVQARRAALVVEFAGSDGYARGFVEWGRAGEPPSTYLADGWARQRESVASPLTVFELALHYVEVSGGEGPTAVRGRPTPLAVRVVVDEATGDATLTRER
jgi:hypothetical protein